MKRNMIMMMVLIGSMLMAQDREVAVVPDDDSVDPGLKEGDIAPSWALMSGPCLLYTSPSPRDQRGSRMPSSA